MGEKQNITVGVLALQGAFNEHTQLLRRAAAILSTSNSERSWTFIEVRTEAELNICDGLVIPGGESTAISLVAQRSNLLDPLRDFVKISRKPTWGTCAGLILLSESANRTKKGGQELIGGLDVRVNRNHFGRQIESFQAELDLPFLNDSVSADPSPFRAVFIRAPVVEAILPAVKGAQLEGEESVVAPGRGVVGGEVEILGRVARKVAIGASAVMGNGEENGEKGGGKGDIVAVKQGTVFGTSFHPELTGDPRIHVWWLEEVIRAVERA